MRIIVDTSVLFDRAAIDALVDDPRPKVVPSVAFAERARQIFRDHGVSPEHLRSTLVRDGWVIEPFGPEEAGRIAGQLRQDRIWAKHSRDALIAGHVQDLDELWTANAKDFAAVGLDPRHIVDITARKPPVPDPR